MKKITISACAFILLASCAARENNSAPAPPATPVMLPSRFLNAERFFVKMASATGDTILGFGDTGGGICFLAPDELEKLHLQSKSKKGFVKHIMGMKYIEFADLVADKRIPAPMLTTKFSLSRHFQKVTAPYIIVPGTDGEFRELPQMVKLMPFDVFLGQNFFMGKAWTFDYPKQQVWVNTPLSPSDATNKNVQKIGFRKNANGEKVFGHGSMKIEIDGEEIDVLFDTGATIFLSDDGKKMFHTTDNSIGGSFIARSIFDKWRAKHPDWKYFQKADNNKDIIEVPQVTIGGHTVGPVLFAKRDDENWSQGMISSMDKVVKGAIGGSALKYLRVTVDYNNELIKFE
jgi:hypothetical protein